LLKKPNDPQIIVVNPKNAIDDEQFSNTDSFSSENEFMFENCAGVH
jgi:hypothetical protein